MIKKKHILPGILVLLILVVAVGYFAGWFTAWLPNFAYKSGSTGNTTAGSQTRSGLMQSSNLRLSAIPSAYLNTLNPNEKNIISNLFDKTNNRNGAITQEEINQINSQLAQAGNSTYIVKNDNPKNPSVSKAKCQEGENCWSLNLIFFTMCHCKAYGPRD